MTQQHVEWPFEQTRVILACRTNVLGVHIEKTETMTNIESFEGGTELLQKLRGDMAADPSRFHGKKTYVYIYGRCARGILTTADPPPYSLPTADCGILGLLNAQTGAIENFWFEPGFDSSLTTFIRANPLPYASICCFVMSFRYAERFLTARVPVVLCEGIYLGDIWRGDYWSTIESLPDVEDPLFPEHYWLIVGGHIFDPTAAQWKSDPRREWFKVTRPWSKARVLKRLPYVDRPESDEAGGGVEDWARRLQEYLAATRAHQSLTFESHLTIRVISLASTSRGLQRYQDPPIPFRFEILRAAQSEQENQLQQQDFGSDGCFLSFSNPVFWACFFLAKRDWGAWATGCRHFSFGLTQYFLRQKICGVSGEHLPLKCPPSEAGPTRCDSGSLEPFWSCEAHYGLS